MPGERQPRGLSYEVIWKGQMTAKKEEGEKVHLEEESLRKKNNKITRMSLNA